MSWRLWGVGVPALSGIQREAWPQGEMWQLPWAPELRVRGLWLLAEVFGGGREAEGQTLGYLVSVGRGTSSFLLPTELSECQGKLQELHRLLQSLESLHRIPSAPVIPTHQVRPAGRSPGDSHRFLGTEPQVPLHATLPWRPMRVPGWLPFHIQAVSGSLSAPWG